MSTTPRKDHVCTAELALACDHKLEALEDRVISAVVAELGMHPSHWRGVDGLRQDLDALHRRVYGQDRLCALVLLNTLGVLTERTSATRLDPFDLGYADGRWRRTLPLSQLVGQLASAEELAMAATRLLEMLHLRTEHGSLP